MVKYKLLQYDNNKVQVESAIRDGNGVKIDTNYALKAEIPDGSVQYVNQSVTFALQSTPDYSDYPYRASFSASGVTASTYASITYSPAQSASGNYGQFCKTDIDIIYLYAKADVGTQTIPTISIGLDYSDVPIDSTPTSGSSNAVSSGGVYTNCVRTTGNQNIDGEKTFLNRVSVQSNSVTEPYRWMNTNLPSNRATFGSTIVENSMVCITNGNGNTFADLEFFEVPHTIRAVLMRLYSPTKNAWKGMALTDDGTDVFATTPYRTSNITDNDVLTAGNGVTLSTVQHLTNKKYIDFNSGGQTALALTTDVAYTSGDFWSPNIRFYGDNSGKVIGDIFAIKSSATSGRVVLDAYEPGTGTWKCALSLRTEGNDNYVTIPYRTYNSANTSDVVTIGSLASNPSVVHPTYTHQNITFNTIDGLTITPADNNNNSKGFELCGNILVINLALNITGTYTGTTGWQTLFDWPAGTNGIRAPYLMNVIDFSSNSCIRLHQGRYLYFTNGTTYNYQFNCQVICPYNG